MLTPSQFASRWQAEIVEVDDAPEDVRLIKAPAQIESLPLPEDALRFLIEAGLPASCAPFLSFEEVGKGLPRIWEVFSPGQWKERETKPLAHYRIMGSDGSGNPICLDERDGRVVLLDHEGRFAPEQFVNSSVAHLAECLLSYPKSRDNLESFRQIDEPAARDGAFWFHEAAMAKEDDEDEMMPAKGQKPWWKFW